jgi:1-deoxy-D-xylulose-5-phosphate reductoisomerase
VTTREGPNHRTGIAVLGSTGSIGRQTLDVIDAYPDHFRVVSLAARSPSRRFFDQIARYRPEIAAVGEPDGAGLDLASLATGEDGLVAAATHPAVDIVVVATSGHAAIVPTIRAVECGKIIALANKETLVCAGEVIVPLARSRGQALRPVDSEHSAIWQSMHGAPRDEVSRIILTASGGPFRKTPAALLAGVSVQEAMAHPTWSMGSKVTIDSATLMNKGLEIIEARWLFDLAYDQIEVLIHPESIVHSLVEFVDGAQVAQLGLPDMRLPIQYALTYPNRAPLRGKRLDLAAIGALHFEKPDLARFPALRLARQAGEAGRTYPTVLSAADHEAVAAFVGGALAFADIAKVVEDVLGRHVPEAVSLGSIMTTDEWARRTSREVIQTRFGSRG